MYKYVFIDLDDTLWDFHANAKSTLEEVYNARNLGKFFDNFEQYFQPYTKRNLELWVEYGKGAVTKEELTLERFLHPLRLVGINDSELALNMGREYLDLLPSRTALVPYAIELLEYLHAKYPLTIVSNGFKEVQYKKIESSNIGQYFAHIVLSEGAGALKPDKRIFEYAMNLNGAKPHESIMIGDSYEADIVGAQNAGIDQIYFIPLLAQDENDKSATHKVKRLEEITTII